MWFRVEEIFAVGIFMNALGSFHEGFLRRDARLCAAGASPSPPDLVGFCVSQFGIHDVAETVVTCGSCQVPGPKTQQYFFFQERINTRYLQIDKPMDEHPSLLSDHLRFFLF